MENKFLDIVVKFTIGVCVIGLLYSIFNIVTFDNLSEVNKVSYPLQHLFEMGIFTIILVLAVTVKSDI